MALLRCLWSKNWCEERGERGENKFAISESHLWIFFCFFHAIFFLSPSPLLVASLLELLFMFFFTLPLAWPSVSFSWLRKFECLAFLTLFMPLPMPSGCFSLFLFLGEKPNSLCPLFCCLKDVKSDPLEDAFGRFSSFSGSSASFELPLLLCRFCIKVDMVNRNFALNKKK